ncbi:MAG: hypothetical protein HND46_07165 [Chloroflexi bacterium]|nr:hypothetical protein [Chloroflexota bacterium]NOG63184.1 hypothetical protein [Chloroflexota bacterium]
MRRWGWRWLFCWLSVLVTACAQLSSTTPTPKPQTRTPSLQGFTPQATAPPTLPVRPVYTLTPFGNVATRRASQQLSSFIGVDAPTCYESAVQSLVCIGWIRNTGDDPLLNPLITVYLLTPQGQPIQITDTTTALSLLSGHTSLPYRVIFSEIPTESWTTYADVRGVEALVIDSPPLIVSLSVINVETTWNGSEYLIEGEIVNDMRQPLESIRALAAFTTSSGQLSGFRSQEITLTDPDTGKVSFSIRATPLTGQPDQVEVMAQGYIRR